MQPLNVHFELVVWHAAERISRERAARLRQQFAAGADAEAKPQVAAFTEALSALFPEVEITARPGHAVVTMEPDVADTVSAHAFALARQHSLVCYDPVRDLVHNLGPLGVYPEMQLRTGDGLIIVNPDLGLVHDALATLSPQNPFLTLVNFGQHFLQVSPTATGYELEFKDSVAGRMLRTTIRDLAELRRCFAEYAAGDHAFRARHVWVVV
jgi:hypothetical protein